MWPYVILHYVFDVLQDLLQIRSYVYAEEPNIDIHNFIGTFTRVSDHITHFICHPISSGPLFGLWYVICSLQLKLLEHILSIHHCNIWKAQFFNPCYT